MKTSNITHEDGTVAELIAMLSVNCLSSQILACQMLGSLGELAQASLPALRNFAANSADIVAIEADKAMKKIVTSKYVSQSKKINLHESSSNRFKNTWYTSSTL